MVKGVGAESSRPCACALSGERAAGGRRRVAARLRILCGTEFAVAAAQTVPIFSGAAARHTSSAACYRWPRISSPSTADRPALPSARSTKCKSRRGQPSRRKPVASHPQDSAHPLGNFRSAATHPIRAELSATPAPWWPARAPLFLPRKRRAALKMETRAAASAEVWRDIRGGAS